MSTSTKEEIEELVGIEETIPCHIDECTNDVMWMAHHHNKCHVFICNEHVKLIAEFKANLPAKAPILCIGCNDRMTIEDILVAPV